MFAKIAVASAVAVAAQASHLGYGQAALAAPAYAKGYAHAAPALAPLGHAAYGQASLGHAAYGHAAPALAAYGQAPLGHAAYGHAAPALASYGHAAPLSYAAAAPVAKVAAPLAYAAAAPVAKVAAPVVAKQIAYAPQPYKFGYDSVDEYGTKQSRHEVSDEHNNKKGSYSFTDARGISRLVEYVADAHGFRATIKTNEPGTASSNPAGALYNAQPIAIKAVAAAPVAAYAKAPIAAYAKAPVAAYGAPIAHAAPIAAYAKAPVAAYAQPIAHAAPLAHAAPVAAYGHGAYGHH